MVSKRRFFESGYPFHVLNRGSNRQRLFFRDGDYDHFESLIAESLQQFPLEVFTYELMPNHWHFLIRAARREDMSDFFQYLSGTHSKRFRALTDSVGEGHVYQDRFKSFPIECDDHFLTVARYIERNAKRAQLVERAEDWRWSGLWRRLHQMDDWLTSDWPVPRPKNWVEFVNDPMTAAELAAVRTCVRRGRPFGSPSWVATTAKRLGLQHTLRRPGRPRLARR